jgi:hypothetical protein
MACVHALGEQVTTRVIVRSQQTVEVDIQQWATRATWAFR